MRGEWFDTVSNCVTFSIGAKPEKPKEVTEFRNTLVRLMSLCHGSALEEIAGNQIKLEAIDVFGLDDGTLNHLKECHEVHGFNKVEVMLHLVQSLITRAHTDGVLKIPPPILSRVYQTISRGFVNLLNAKKITDTRFPFPYAQLISFLLLLHTVLTPMIISGVIRSKVLAAIFAFVPVFGMFSLNFIASELENPFGTDDNDLPLEHFQTEMNSCLLMLLHTNTDMIAGTSPRCITNFEKLLATMQFDRSSHSPDNKMMSRLSAFESSGKDAEELPAEVVETNVPVAPPAAAPLPPEPVKEAPKKEEKQPLLTAPAQPEAQKIVDIQPRLAKSMEEFTSNLQCWANTLESNVNQMRRLFDELKVLSDHLPALLSKRHESGWETAVSPAP